MTTNKQKAASSSVLAAIFLTGMKLIVGILTGSLGILAEAAHSGLDLIAALITFFAVRMSDRPSDVNHNYGFGKVENISALFETLLLLITCVWIIYEAVGKIIGKSVEITGVAWGLVVMVISIVVDYSRSRLLRKAAKEHNSQALEADALHFSSDIMSSSVVIVGLIFVWLGHYYQLPALHLADPIAALGVSAVVIFTSMRLGKQSLNFLIDTAPHGIQEEIHKILDGIDDVLEIHKIRVRTSGPRHFVDLNIGLSHDLNMRSLENVKSLIEKKVKDKVPNCDLIISGHPVLSDDLSDLIINQTVRKVIEEFQECKNAHSIRILQNGKKKIVSANAELLYDMHIEDAQKLRDRIKSSIKNQLPGLKHLHIDFEQGEAVVHVDDITESRQDIIEKIESILAAISKEIVLLEAEIFQQEKIYYGFFHIGVPENLDGRNANKLSKKIILEIRNNFEYVEYVHVHFELIPEMSESRT